LPIKPGHPLLGPVNSIYWKVGPKIVLGGKLKLYNKCIYFFKEAPKALVQVTSAWEVI